MFVLLKVVLILFYFVGYENVVNFSRTGFSEKTLLFFCGFTVWVYALVYAFIYPMLRQFYKYLKVVYLENKGMIIDKNLVSWKYVKEIRFPFSRTIEISYSHEGKDQKILFRNVMTWGEVFRINQDEEDTEFVREIRKCVEDAKRTNYPNNEN